MNKMYDYVVAYLRIKGCYIPKNLNTAINVGRMVAKQNTIANFRCCDYEFSIRYYPDTDDWRISILMPDEIYNVYRDADYNISIEIIDNN
jgi:hypothetical protein